MSFLFIFLKKYIKLPVSRSIGEEYKRKVARAVSIRNGRYYLSSPTGLYIGEEEEKEEVGWSMCV